VTPPGTLDAVPDNMLTSDEAAARVGVTAASWRSYVARGDGPKPDGHLGRTPWWKPETVDAWKASRPGQGAGGGRPRKA
jgi:hypothetical protein